MSATIPPDLKRKSPPLERLSSEDRTASPTPSTRSSGKQQVRHRASIACASCRERRIRCVVREGETECAQCRRTGNTCIIKNDDERRRPISKAYMSSLSNRIALLEEMLKEQGVTPPPAVHPPKTRHDARQQELEDAQARERSKSSEPKPDGSGENQVPTPPGSGEEDVTMSDQEHNMSAVSAGQTPSPCLIDPMLFQDADSQREPDVRHVLSARGTQTFDPAAGRVRFFGPTANSHVHGRSACLLDSQSRSGSASRASRTVDSLTPFTHDYLLKCFWDHYDPGSPVVDQNSFETGRASQDARLYSPFLHLTMLAVGFRFADQAREDIKRLSAGSREGTLHREAKSLLNAELELPAGLPSVQGLLLLADLEFGIGRDSTGWLYLGIANRLAFDIGLHVNPNVAEMSDTERRLRRQVMAACVCFDRQWALALGRPTSIKIQDIGVNLLQKLPSPISMQPMPSPDAKTVAAGLAAIRRYSFELLELAGKIADLQNTSLGINDSTPKDAEDKAYLYFLALERQFQNWYRRLPDCLTWKPANIKSAPLGFFMLHQQFHTCMILLHRPWAKYGPLMPGSVNAAQYLVQESSAQLHASLGTFPQQNNRASLSRSMCTQNAVRVAKIFWQHRQRFDGTKISPIAIQHAGTTALALMAALAHKSAELDHQSNLKYLQVVSSAIYDMSHAYQPAARMYNLLKTMLADIRTELVNSGSFNPAAMFQPGGSSSSGTIFGSNAWSSGSDGGISSLRRHSTSFVIEGRPDVKRRRLSTQVNLPRPDFSQCSSPLAFNSNQYMYHSPPKSSHSQQGFFGSLDQPLKEIPEMPSEPEKFDLDFYHASFVDFINTSGQGWTTESTTDTVVPQTPSSLIAPAVEDKQAVGDVQGAPQKADDAQPSDDAVAELTIEEWLAEPKQGIVQSPSISEHHSQARFSPVPDAAPASETTVNDASGADSTTFENQSGYASPPENEFLQKLGLSLGLDLGLSSPHPQDHRDDMISMGWLVGNNSEASPSMATMTKTASTPITLDELAQSVDEAVDCARARAREKEKGREKQAAAANAKVVEVVVSSPEMQRRNVSLDYLKL
ncbi:fungal-specific transcription factor domain-containing protein [Podospora fimiseda]|uniref:Fungal-specific transcription factor domain-containing protein n=1 Tax=Podospora fimiseda TaxID=252190 RepID=A0AAN7GYU2_9PEZI|nr:fungal-specific transcription factor domain-containing protein [Podospora fimiseda]